MMVVMMMMVVEAMTVLPRGICCVSCGVMSVIVQTCSRSTWDP
jgi:hypothetical protein